MKCPACGEDGLVVDYPTSVTVYLDGESKEVSKLELNKEPEKVPDVWCDTCDEDIKWEDLPYELQKVVEDTIKATHLLLP